MFGERFPRIASPLSPTPDVPVRTTYHKPSRSHQPDRIHAAAADYQTNIESKKEIETLMETLHQIDVDTLDRIIALLEHKTKT